MVVIVILVNCKLDDIKGYSLDLLDMVFSRYMRLLFYNCLFGNVWCYLRMLLLKGCR